VPTLAEVRADGIFGILASQVAAADGPYTDSSFAVLPVIASGQFAKVVFYTGSNTGDPIAGSLDIRYCTSHAINATSATFLGNQEPPSASQSQPPGTRWALAPTSIDFAGRALLWVPAVTANATAAAGQAIPVDTTSNPVTITLPVSATNGDMFRVALAATASTPNPVTVGGAIAGYPSGFSWTTVNASYDFQYTGTVWRIV
jgi:hypothetical protein